MSILIKPIITEKATRDTEAHNRYSFEVDIKASKPHIKQEVEALYGVKVEKVRTMIYGPKRKVRYTKTGMQLGKKSGYKKATVQLKEGQSIDFYSNI